MLSFQRINSSWRSLQVSFFLSKLKSQSIINSWKKYLVSINKRLRFIVGLQDFSWGISLWYKLLRWGGGFSLCGSYLWLDWYGILNKLTRLNLRWIELSESQNGGAPLAFRSFESFILSYEFMKSRKDLGLRCPGSALCLSLEAYLGSRYSSRKLSPPPPPSSLLLSTFSSGLFGFSSWACSSFGASSSFWAGYGLSVSYLIFEFICLMISL